VALRRENRNLIFLLALLVAVLTGFLWYFLGPALAPSGQSQSAVRVYFADRISSAHRKIIDRFNQIHQGRIEVVAVDLPFDKFSTNERKELLARSLRSRSDKLDLFAVDLIWIKRFARWCEPLDPYFSREERRRFLPVALQSCLSESSLVAVPLHLDIGLMYYRQDLIDRLPDAALVSERLRESISWPDLLALQQRLQYNGKPFYLFQADEYEGLVCTYLETVRSFDPDYHTAKGMDLDSPVARTALQFLVDLVWKYRASPPEVTEFDEQRSYNYMLAQDAVFVRGWPNFVENYTETHGATRALRELRKAALPHVPGRPPTSVFGGWDLMLSKFSTHKPEAIEFIHFLGTREAQRILYEVEGFLPVAQEIYGDSTYMRAHPDLAYYHTLLERGFHRPALVEYTRISDILSHYVRLAIRKELPVSEALRLASRKIHSNSVLIP
jgi:multiple sugar transport system substrate-binding protein